MFRGPSLLAVVLVALVASPAAHGAASSMKMEIGPVDCAAGGSWATITNPGQPLRYEVLRGATVVDTMLLPASATPERVLVPIADGLSTTVTVRAGASYVSRSVRAVCPQGAQTPQPALTASGVEAPTPVVAASEREDAAPADDGVTAGTWLLVAGAATLAALLVAAAGWLLPARRRRVREAQALRVRG